MFSTECADGACCAAFREDLVGAAPPDSARRGDLLAQRRDRLVAGVPRPVRAARRGRFEPQRNVGQPRRSTGSWRRSSRRRRDGLDEPDGRLVPAHRGSRTTRCTSAASASSKARRRRSSASRRWSPPSSTPCRATARRSASCRSSSAGRCGSTTLTSTSPTTCATARCRRPGTEEILRRTAARIFAQHLDRRKPLWEIWMVEGLSENRWALLSKVHHCMVDGVSATDLMTVMFDDAPARPAGAGAGSPARSRATPSSSCAR